MAKAKVNGVRSLDVAVPDLEAAVRFYEDVWRLKPVQRSASTAYLRGSGPSHHLLALHASDAARVLRLVMTADDRTAVDGLHAQLVGAGTARIDAPGPIDEPGGGYGFSFIDLDGRNILIVAEDAQFADAAVRADEPYKITHVVMYAHSRQKTVDFYTEFLGFRIIDWVKPLTFLNCNSDHHTVAIGEGKGGINLDHIAFEMKDIDSVMRGAGRMKLAGYDIDWGVGRHGPADNVYAYFVGPHNEVIEYTTEVEQVGDDYVAHGPEWWLEKVPTSDQWNIWNRTEKMNQVHGQFPFRTDEMFKPAGCSQGTAGLGPAPD